MVSLCFISETKNNVIKASELKKYNTEVVNMHESDTFNS